MKLRIYELAKELGVDNKVVITKAAELGFPGKVSHSNTLDSSEVEAIRRAVLKKSSGVSSDREVVTHRVDKVTGETSSVVEKRKGNVIRRRRADDAPAAAPVVEVVAPVSEPELAVAGQSQGDGEPAVAHVAPEQQEAPAKEAAPIESIVAPVATVEVERSASDSESAPTSEVAEVVPAAAAPVQAVAAKVATPAPKGVPGSGTMSTPSVPDFAKKGVGPKILGKIELLKKAAPAPASSSAVRRPGFGPTAPARAVTASFDDDDGKKVKSLKGKKREFSRTDLMGYEERDVRRMPRNTKNKAARQGNTSTEVTTPKASKRVVELGESIIVGDLARQLSVKSGEIIAKLIELGVFATINQALDKDTATILAEEFGYTVTSTTFDEITLLADKAGEEEKGRIPRPPVVTVMGHVDHGKTTLLDTIRNTTVASGEAGGITQHIGAYQVKLDDGRQITFLDTPGHAAFTAIRARGANATDVVILVVAADDGVMPQTLEALNHAKAAKVPIIVAVNKIDKPGAQIDRIKQQLAEHGLQPEEWGGDTMFCPVSALQKKGITELLERVLLQAEMKQLTSNPARRAKGVILESKQERGRGTVATVLVQNGTLRVGDLFVCGANAGRVRSMRNYRGEVLEEAPPSTPVEITGVEGVPEAGDDFAVVENEAAAKDIAANRAEIRAGKERAKAAGPISLEEFSRRANSVAAAELNVVLKGDVHGSVEAIEAAITALATDKVKVKVLHAAVGGINESDVQLARASKGLIVGFNVRGEVRALAEAEQAGIEVRFYRIIYELIDDVKKAMAGLLEPIRQEVSLGRAEVRNTFVIPKFGTIAGCFVNQGLIKRGAMLRLLRDSKVVYEGKMGSLKRFKDDVREVQTGFECGISFDGYNDVKLGDVLEAYEFKEIAATL